MALHIVHFIGPINHHSACTVRNCCLEALQKGATEIALHISTEGGNTTPGFALYFFLKSLPIPGQARIYTAEEAVGAGIVHEAVQARLPTTGPTCHWWN